MIIFAKIIPTWNHKYQVDRQVNCSINIDGQVYLEIETPKTDPPFIGQKACVTMDPEVAKEFAESILRQLKRNEYIP